MSRKNIYKIFGVTLLLIISLISVKAEDVNIENYVVLNEYDPDNVYVPINFYTGAFATDEGNKVARTLLRFNIDLLKKKKIAKAVLRLEVKLEKEGTTNAKQVLEVYKVLGEWGRATWNNQPECGELIDTVEITDDGNYKLDLTDLVQYWIINPESNFGILLKAQDETTINYKEFTRNYWLSVTLAGELSECEINKGVCKYSCSLGEEELDYSCEVGVCCGKIGKPDLIVEKIEFIHRENSYYEIWANFKNIGESSSGEYDFKAYINDIEFISGSDLTSLDPEEENGVVLGTRELSGGDIVKVIVDSEDEIEEENEGNNEKEEIVSIVECEDKICPDGSISECHWVGDEFGGGCECEICVELTNCNAVCHQANPGGWLSYNFEHTGFEKFEIIFNWSDTPKENNVGIYPALLHFWFEAGQGGYTGPQIEVFDSGDSIVKKVIFSIWSMNNQGFTAHPYSDWCDYGDTEGNFVRCMITDYEWVEGKEYKITVQKDEELEDGVVWKAIIQDIELGQEKLIGKIKLEDQGIYNGYGLLRRDTGGFFEYYFGDYNKCLQAEYGKITRKGPYADGKWLARKATYQNTECIRAKRYSPETGVIIEEVGEGVERSPDEPLTGILWEFDHDTSLNLICTDYDGGLNYLEYGECVGKDGNVARDECFTIPEDGGFFEIFFRLLIETFGDIFGEDFISELLEETILIEYFCTEEGICDKIEVNCNEEFGEDYICENGACINTVCNSNGVCEEEETLENCPEDCFKTILTCQHTYTKISFGGCDTEPECDVGDTLTDCEEVEVFGIKVKRDHCERTYETECLENPACEGGYEIINTERCYEEECIDSDGGREYYEEGVCIDNNGEFSDYCDNSVLHEVTCESGGFCATEEEGYECPYGCQDGACIEQPPSQTYLKVSPASQTVNKDDEFTIDIEILDVNDLYGFQFDVGYNNTILEYEGVTLGNFLGEPYNGITGEALWIPMKESLGKIEDIACVRFVTPEGVDGSGVLITITFKAIGLGQSDITLENVQLIDSNTNEIEVTISHGVVVVESVCNNNGKCEKDLGETVDNCPGDCGDVTIEGDYTGFYEFPNRFFDESIISKEQILKVTDAQYLGLKNMHNGISPYNFAKIEYEPLVYGSTTPTGIKLGDSAFPSLNSGHPRWEVMAHEQGHNFFGGTSAFYGFLAFPYPFLQESFAVLSAFYTYHYILDNQQILGIDSVTINSLNFDFTNGRDYQESMYNQYVSEGKNFDINNILTSQALDYKMIVYGETYGWQNYKKLAKYFENSMSNYFTFYNDGASAIEQSTYIVAALSASFNQDFRQDFRDLNFPINEDLYIEIYNILYPASQECTDDDGGLNYYVKGRTIDGDQDYQDFCSEDGMQLNEFYCSGGNFLSSTLYNCPNGCENGACIGKWCDGPSQSDPLKKESCVDSSGAEAEDGCFEFNKNFVEEWYCRADECRLDTADCPGDTVCKDGACVEECKLLSAKWATSSGNLVEQTNENDLVYLWVTGNSGCNGLTINYKIYEDDPWPTNDDYILPDPPSVIFADGVAKTTWTAKYVDDGAGDPEFYFKAFTDGLVKKSDNLKVFKLISHCEGGAGTDDSDCGIIDCSSWYVKTGTKSSTSTQYCYNKKDITNNRCEGVEDCKDANTADCNGQGNDILKYSCGTCKYIDDSDCTGTNLASCSNYPQGTSCGSGKVCDGNGNCVTQVIGTHLYVNPSSTSVNNGNTVNLNITISNVVDLFAFQFDVSYNNVVLDYQGITLGNFLGEPYDGLTGEALWIPMKESPGKIEDIGCVRFVTPEGVDGSGVLITITFKAIGLGHSNINLEEVQLIDSNSNEIEATISHGGVSVS